MLHRPHRPFLGDWMQVSPLGHPDDREPWGDSVLCLVARWIRFDLTQGYGHMELPLDGLVQRACQEHGWKIRVNHITLQQLQ